ncbi:MAG: hypothetical protein ACRC8W_13890 [Plesiomonas shigelloides]
MNAKARMLGMWNTHFADSTGLNPRNVSSAQYLAKLAVTVATLPKAMSQLRVGRLNLK